MKQTNSKNSQYLDFIRTRPCSLCFSPNTEPHHVFKRLRGISEAGMAQKGSHYLAIPVCRLCHERLGNASLKPSRDELLELIVINLICYMGGCSFPRSNEAHGNDG
jgi:hypothetical protein